MNKLYQILYPGSFLPWAIMIIFYVRHLEIFHFISSILYISFAITRIIHKPIQNIDVQVLGEAFKICELMMVVRLLILNQTESGFISTVATTSLWSVISKLKPSVRHKILKAPVFVATIVGLLSTTRSSIQALSGIFFIILLLFKRKIDFKYYDNVRSEMQLRRYYNTEILMSYCIFMMEWGSTKIHWLSLPIVLTLSLGFQYYAFKSIPLKNDADLTDYYIALDKIPDHYPMPLNFKEAVEQCNIAKKVFKQHSI